MSAAGMMALLKQRRVDNGVTQVELAEWTGLPQQSISEWERGLHAPTVENLELVAAALGYRLALVEGRPWESE